LNKNRKIVPLFSENRVKGNVYSNKTNIRSRKLRNILWYLLVNISICASLLIISQGALIAIIPYLFVAVCILPIISLCFSRWRVKFTYQMRLLDPTKLSREEAKLYGLVQSLCHKAGLEHIPQIGIYKNNEEMNAFAVGASQKRSLIAFSSRLLEELDEQSLTAVTAHEVSHISNGDMLTMSLVQSAINTVVVLCLIPLKCIEWVIRWIASREGGRFIGWITAAIGSLLAAVLAFLGLLVVRAFSRQREYRADRLAAHMVGKESMIRALQILDRQEHRPNRYHKGYLSFKIAAPQSFFFLLSTHPPIAKRIKALRD
jgi:heat shock protein HtpX